jgi:hypothetical protein
LIVLRFLTDRLNVESAVIRFATRSWCSHVEFCRVENGIAVDTLGSRLRDGVQIRTYDYCRPTAESWFTAPNIQDAYDFGLTLVGKKYDWLDILGIGFNTRQHREGNYICSSFIDACGKAASPMRWTNIHFPSRLVTPRDLLASPVITRVRRVLG